MTKLRYLRQSHLSELRKSILTNLPRYRSGDFDDVFAGEEYSREIEGDFSLKDLSKLKHPKDGKLFDAVNSELVYVALESLTPHQATEERLWAHQCHFECLDYVRTRWKIPDDDEAAVGHINTHFFASNSRGVERDNGISRLWWMGLIASRAKGFELREALDVLMFRTDVRANIIERPTTSSSVNVLSALLRALKTSLDGKKLLHERKHLRELMKEINSVGGVRLLETLDGKALDQMMNTIIKNRLGLAET